MRQEDDFTLDLLRHARFAETVDSIVVEFVNARYQSRVDRYIAGRHVSRPALQHAEPNRDHADCHATCWLTRKCEDGWEVVRVRLPAGVRIDQFTETAEAKARRPEASDPRPASIRNIGGP